MRKLDSPKMACIVIVFCAATAILSSAQTFTSLASFDLAEGDAPGWLVQGTNGNLYGLAQFGGLGFGYGTIFQVTPSGELTKLYAFSCSNSSCLNGGLPTGGLLLAANGGFYGLTSDGGNSSNAGTAFEFAPTGKLITLYSFCALPYCADGHGADALLQATNGNFYGTTSVGDSFGAFFEMTLAGKVTTLYTFCPSKDGSDCPDGANPTPGLVQASDGNYYGTASGGGANGQGTIFQVTPAGKLTTLYSFCSKANCADGASPQGLIQATNGNFYGATYAGGSVGTCLGGCGTIFEITPAGKLTTLHTFCEKAGCPVGPAFLMQATDGNFYGTSIGGVNEQRTIFRITPQGSFTTLYDFCPEQNCPDGRFPETSLMQATNGTFYGTTAAGGALGFDYGTVFSLSMGLGPFVKTVPTAGKVGAHVIIMGNNLTGTTGVSFNGTAATFTVASDTEIKASVPTGATRGVIEVVTPSGSLDSNVAFRVVP
jgi:uncharacterized repeat protein (TIGR03803 family)